MAVEDIDFSSAIVGAPKPGTSVKKKSQPQIEEPITLGSSSVSQPLNSSSVSTIPTKDKLRASNLGITGVDWAKGDKEEISATDDLWNTLKGAGVKAFSTLASLPNKAQEAALDMFVSATGMSSDFNKLPSADKKQIRDSLSGLLRSGQQVGGTALAGQPRVVEISDKATQFLNKKSEDIYKRTRQEDVNVIDELDKFRQNPNAESIEKILYEGLKTTVESIPNMAIGAVSLPLLGVAAAAGKREEDLKETGGNLGIGYLLNAGISGTAEAIFEGTTNKILKKASRAAFGNPAASKAVAEGFVKSIAKDMGEEGVSEGLTTLVQDLSDKITKGEEIDYWKLAKNVANSTILGAMSGGGISGGGKTIGAARRYVAGKIMPKDQIEKIDNNTDTIQSLNLEQGEDVDPEVNKIVNQKISDLMAENESIITQNEEIASKLSADQVKEIFDIDDKLDENYNSARSIIDDATMDDSAKELLLKDLLDKQNNLKQQKDAIQKQATSEVPIQPEAGASLQVAEGEPQAEPQVPAEEVKTEEVKGETPKAESVEGKMQSVFGLNKTQSKAASVVIDKIVGTMAGRSGTTKEEIYNTISFEKGEPTEQVTVERPVEKVKPTKTTPKVEGPIDTEVKFNDAIDNQVVSWNKFPEQKKGKGIASRNQVLTKAANDLLNGNITNEQYRAIVEKESPIKPIETFFNPSTGQDIQGALEASKVPLVNSVTSKGEKFVDPKTNQEFEIVSDKVGLRLDIPAYLNNNKWVVTVHADAKNSSTGKVTKDKPVSYTSVAKIKNVTFDYNPNLASKIAKGESSRETRFKMRGELVPVEGTNVDEQNANAKKEVQSIQKDPSWVQIGTNPFRHSYFYNRSNGKAVLSADEVIQIGGLVYAKNTVEANWNDEKFGVTQNGQSVLDKKGNQVYFQDNKATVSLANDGRFIVTALTDPNVSTPLHEMAHIYEHYLENKERRKILKWAGKKDWDMSVSEKFSRGFEKYLSEGKSPSAELNKIFDNFKKWLLNIYNGITSSDIDIQLNKEMRKIYDTMLSGEGKQVKAPSVDKVLAKPAPKKVTVQEMAALKDQIKLEIKAAKGGAKFADDVRKSISAKVKEFITRGKMSVAQQKTLLNGLKGNLLNPVIRERFFARMEKMFNRIDYKDRLDEANKYRKQIKKLAKSDTLQDSVKNMASNFAKIIPDFTDIDQFLEKAREVYNAIKTPGLKGKALTTRQAAIIDDVNNFTQKIIKAQEERVKNTLLDQYEYLVETGKISEDMSLEEIQNYIMDIDRGLKESEVEKEEEIRAQLKELFDLLSDDINEIIETGENPITGEEVELDSYTKSLVKNFIKMDLSQLSVQNMYRATEALDNFMVNGIIDNMGSIYGVYDGALKDKKLVDEGIKASDLKRAGLFGRSNIFARTWAVNISPIKSIIDLMFRSREIGSKVFNATGLRDIANASSKVKNIIQKIDKAYVDRFGKTKPNGQDFDSAENTYQRGMYAYLRRNRFGTKAQMDAEFKRRKGQVEKTIADLEKTDDKSLIKKVTIYKQLFESIKDAENIEQVEAMIDPINIDAVKWWTSIFETYYPEVKQIAASVYNTVLEDDINYTPDINEKIIEDNAPDVDQKSSYRMAFNYLNSEKSGTLMKNKRKPLPENRVLNFDFDYNNSSALTKMLVDIKTAPYVQQYKGFTQSKSFEKLFPDAKDRNVIKERMNWYVNEVRSKNISTASPRTADAAKLLRTLSRYGTAKALGSVSALAKQSIPAFINTTINLANNPLALTKGMALMANKDAQKFINNSGYGIANRGLESQTAIESADRILENTDVKSIDKISKSIDKVGKFWLNTFLKNGDVFVARSSWMAYYISKLDKMGENTSNIDWATHKLNKEAADYAEDQVNLQQNVSDTDMLGKFLNSKNPGVTIARTLILPFSSFIFNAKDKISTDLTILASNSNKTEKINAAKSLAGTAAEMVAFELLSAAVTNYIITTAYSILGYEEDEEEIQTRIDKNLNMATTRILTDAISPIPNWGDKALVGLTNAVLNYAQQDLDEEERKLLYEYKPQDYKDAILGLIGGVPEIAIKPAREIASTIEMITSDSYFDKYGNEIILSLEDKDKLKFVLATEVLMTTNALPNEVNRINQKVKDKIIKEAR